MKPRHLFPSLLVFFICLLLVTSAQAQQWKPLDPAHLALKAPVVEKGADAEALLWEVYVNDSSNTDTEFVHLVRIKVFTERGKEAQSKLDIHYPNGVQVKDISGRTIKPDGTIVELKKDAVFDREIVKFGRFKLKAKSFALPGIEPGAIIEYRWREIYQNGVNYVPLYFQRDIPIQTVRYYLKPHPRAFNPMRTITFQGNNPSFVKESNGYYRTEMTHMPAFREEPHMPPKDQVRTWMLVYYAPEVSRDAASYWKDHGRLLYETFKGEMKVNDDIRKAATEAIGDATPEQKLERLFNFSRTKIKNINDDASGLTADQLKKMKENRSAADTLKRGYGTGMDINFLFAALATAAGFEARLATLSDRSHRFFDPNFTNPHFMNASNIAVKVGEKWQFFDPSSTYVPFGMLRWQEEGIQALICDSKEPVFTTTPLSSAEKSLTKRTAKLRLTEDGMLEGEVRVEQTGHFAVSMKEDYDEESASEREKRLLNALSQRLNGAEAEDIKIESANDPLKPFVYSYKVRLSGYAERTGKRLFLQPAFFQKGVGQMFATTARLHDIYFHFPWMEQDEVAIDLPAGFALDNADQPGDLTFGDVGYYKSNLRITQDQRTLYLKRNFRFTGLIFPKTSYSALKQAFDAVHRADNHTITLKQVAVAAVKQ
jgi:hypothetical protein